MENIKNENLNKNNLLDDNGNNFMDWIHLSC
jgi:hypothetical protein